MKKSIVFISLLVIAFIATTSCQSCSNSGRRATSQEIKVKTEAEAKRQQKADSTAHWLTMVRTYTIPTKYYLRSLDDQTMYVHYDKTNAYKIKDTVDIIELVYKSGESYEVFYSMANHMPNRKEYISPDESDSNYTSSTFQTYIVEFKEINK